jgi:hypothetical protein
VEEALPIFTKLAVALVNKSGFNASFNIKKDGFGILLLFYNKICMSPVP